METINKLAIRYERNSVLSSSSVGCCPVHHRVDTSLTARPKPKRKQKGCAAFGWALTRVSATKRQTGGLAGSVTITRTNGVIKHGPWNLCPAQYISSLQHRKHGHGHSQRGPTQRGNTKALKICCFSAGCSYERNGVITSRVDEILTGPNTYPV
jgi:hypothetical protein